MSIKAYTEDIQRGISVTPTVDITGQTVLAKVYKDGVYVGIANTVRPDPETSTATLNITNANAGALNRIVTILAKYRHETVYTSIKQQTINVAPGTANYEVSYDQKDKEDVKLEINESALTLVNSVSLEQAQFNDLVGLVVGGAANEEVVIPCDFRRFEAGSDYSLVFVAANYGVIGRDVLILFDKDGYGLGDEA